MRASERANEHKSTRCDIGAARVLIPTPMNAKRYSYVITRTFIDIYARFRRSSFGKSARNKSAVRGFTEIPNRTDKRDKSRRTFPRKTSCPSVLSIFDLVSTFHRYASSIAPYKLLCVHTPRMCV